MAENNFASACRLLFTGHSHSEKIGEGTLNRLFQKNLKGRGETTLPVWLSEKSTAVSLETFSTSALFDLLTEDQKTVREKRVRDGQRVNPRYDCFPVIIVRYRGEDYLIDGGTRAHKWFREGDKGEHDAYVLTVNDRG